MRLSDRAARFFATSGLAARVYLGYKAITLAEKQLGLKLQKDKRPGKVIVVDHIEQTPTPD